MFTVYGVYLIPENRMIYIGQTNRDPHVRYHEHVCYDAGFKEVVNKYGYDSCLVYILQENIQTREEAFELEAYYTEHYAQFFDLLNIGRGSNNNFSRSKEEMREHYNKTLKVWHEQHGYDASWAKGRTLPEETRRKISESLRSRVITEEDRQRMRESSGVANPVYCIETDTVYPSAAEAARALNVDSSAIISCVKNRGRKSTGGYHFQYPEGVEIKDFSKGPLPEEQKQHLSRIGRGKKHLPESIEKMRRFNNSSKKVYCVETNTIYNSAAEARRMLGLHAANINKACTGELETAGGYHWRFVNEDSLEYVDEDNVIWLSNETDCPWTFNIK